VVSPQTVSHFSGQDPHHPPYLPCADAPQESLAQQPGHLFGPTLKLQHGGQKSALASAGKAQTQGAEAGDKIALVVAGCYNPAAASAGYAAD
jgi:hypothetical protein